MRITLNHIVKEFVSLRRRVTALRDVSLKIEDGEFFVLLGSSGCGKSTLLNVIAGLEQPTSGELRFDEEIVASAQAGIWLPPSKRNIAMVFQSYALYPHLSVYDNIAFPLDVAGRAKSEIAQAVERAAAMLEIAPLLRAKPAELSGGQRQRVAIARALIRQPRCFLLDEPLSNLDAHLRQSTRIELKQLQRRLGITTVYVTHDQTEAMTLGDRIALLRDGAVEQVGKPQELYESPATSFAGRFIGQPPMNLIPVFIEEQGGRTAIRMGTVVWPMTDRLQTIARSLPKREALLGMRPEHLALSVNKTAHALPAKITAVESVGRETFMQLTVEGNKLITLTIDPSIASATSLFVTFDLASAHLFSA